MGGSGFRGLGGSGWGVEAEYVWPTRNFANTIEILSQIPAKKADRRLGFGGTTGDSFAPKRTF